MKQFFITFFMLLVNIMQSSVYADDDFTHIALAEHAKKQQTITPYKAIAQAQESKVNQHMLSSPFSEFKNFALSQKNPLERAALEHQPVSDAIIFVSFSLPKQSLAQWLIASKQIHAPLVLRGMIDHSIKKTEQAILPLVKKVHGGVQINPRLFRAFAIQQVPAIVVINHHGCHTDAECGDKKHFDVIYGQTTLTYALSKLADNGEQAPEVARNLLKTLPGEHDD